jgi:hypothetical protein
LDAVERDLPYGESFHGRGTFWIMLRSANRNKEIDAIPKKSRVHRRSRFSGRHDLPKAECPGYNPQVLPPEIAGATTTSSRA